MKASTSGRHSGRATWGFGAALAARILVVEDDPDTRRGLVVCLSTVGHQVEAVGDGRGALRLAAALRPDLVLLDLGLPGTDGLEMVAAFRRLLPDACIIVLSARDEAKFEPLVLVAGANMYLEKPITAGRLIEVVESLFT